MKRFPLPPGHRVWRYFDMVVAYANGERVGHTRRDSREWRVLLWERWVWGPR